MSTVWGIGFSENKREYTLAECRELVEFLENGGCELSGSGKNRRPSEPSP